MSNYIDWHDLTETEQALANKIITDAMDHVICKFHTFELQIDNVLYQYEMSCYNQSNVTLHNPIGLDENEYEVDCEWWKIEQYVNQYLNQL